MIKRVCLLLFIVTSFSGLKAQIPSFSEEDLKGMSADDFKRYGIDVDESMLSQIKQQLNSEKGIEGINEEEIPSQTTNENSSESKEKIVPKRNESFVSDSVYGKSIMLNANISNDFDLPVRPSDDYIIGEGDEFSVNIWGQSFYSNVLRVKENGYVHSKYTGNIYVKGLTYKQAEKSIITGFGKAFNFSNSEIAVTINYTREIQIHLVGEVNQPGTYRVHANEDVLSIISRGNGVNNYGSVRDIKIVRNSVVVGSFDVYEFIEGRANPKDIDIQNNDYIVVGSKQNIVKISGEVKRTGLFELKEGEGVEQLLDYCGGFTAQAHTEYFMLYRYEDNALKAIPLSNENMKDFILRDGDELVIYQVSNLVRNKVEIKGAVNVPGKYQISEGDKVIDLIQKSGGLDKYAFMEKAFLIRENNEKAVTYYSIDLENLLNDSASTSNMNLKENDVLVVLSNEKFYNKFNVYLKGAVKDEIEIEYTKGMKLRDLLLMAGGLEVGADRSRIEISRVNNLEKSGMDSSRVKVQTVSVDENLNLVGQGEIELKPEDIIFVRQIPNFEIQRMVELSGEVAYPGVYTITKPDERISELIARAGGMTSYANGTGMKIYREKLDGIVIVDFNRIKSNPGGEHDYVLEDGDKIIVPKMESLVSLEGNINYPDIDQIGRVYTPFLKKKRAGHYIRTYGAGFKNRSDKRNVYVKSKNGLVKRTKSFLGINVYPKIDKGDEVIVPRKPEKEKKASKKEFDLNDAFEDLTVKITGFLTLYFLINNTVGNSAP